MFLAICRRNTKRLARHTVSVLALAGALPMLAMPASSAFAQDYAAALKTIDDGLMVSEETATNWFEQKASWGPTYTGSVAWTSFMEMIEDHLRVYGAVDIVKNRFPFERWYTTEYPDTSGWSLVSDGRDVNVASYATQSGSTGPDGVTAEMILYDLGLPEDQWPAIADLAGKIVVFKQAPYVGDGVTGSYSDYEYRTNNDTFLEAYVPVDPTYEGGYRNRDQFGAMGRVITDVLVPSEALAHVVVLDVPPGAAVAGRQHGTPDRYEVPGLLLDAKAGAAVVEDARAGKTATLVLDGYVEEDATAYQLAAVLPGRDYGTSDDKAVFMGTHTDGPGLIQDSGALGILGVLEYYSKIPQDDRPMSIFFYFDTRHFTPGAEDSAPYDYVEDHLEELAETMVGGVLMEHIGGTQMRDEGDDYVPTGQAMTTYINTFGNDLLVDEAISAVDASGLERAQVTVGERNGVLGRPGVNGGVQNDWKGSHFAVYLDKMGGLPSWHITGDWPTSGYQALMDLDRFSEPVFRDQVETGILLVGELMTGDVLAMNPDWGALQIHVTTGAEDSDFVSADAAEAGRAELGDLATAIFEAVKGRDYDAARDGLAQLATLANEKLMPEKAGTVAGLIEQATARLP
ncbi:hypothetical protein [Devosia ginsengisoli]|uniref:hypothetical protein n=1 Tax=Devosia ginsengisoli TaxID=400770 RepID=UPI0026ECBC56|nr:hypothetical protein [Devosia ginsengisoli]MCR6670415.1 hypothetical protein [Devosia ginsengisoli]